MLNGVLRDALGWIGGALILAVAVSNFDAIRSVNRQILGIDGEPQAAGRTLASEPAEAEPQRRASTGGVELKASANGHFEADAEINGRDISLLVDTGASMVVLTYEDAERAGIFVGDGDFKAKSRTANGIARNALVTLDEVCVEDICVRDVQAMVAESGRLHVSLLGMTYLGRLRRIDMQRGRLVLEN